MQTNNDLHSISPTQIQITSTICTFLGIVVTLSRMYIRRAHLWVNDYLAVFSMLFLLTQMGVVVKFEGHIATFLRSYLTIAMFYATVWCARLAILFTIIRIGGGRNQIILLYIMAVIFVLLWGILTGQLFWICEIERRRSSNILWCTPNKQMALLQIVADVFADLTLLLSSLHLFRAIQDNTLRHRLKFIFSSCMAPTLVSIVHVCFILQKKGATMMVIAGIVEASVSLIVASFPVLARLFLRRRSNHSTAVKSKNPILFAPSPNFQSMFDFDECDPDMALPSEVKSVVFNVKTASDLERYTNSEIIPRTHIETLVDVNCETPRPESVHLSMPLPRTHVEGPVDDSNSDCETPRPQAAHLSPISPYA